MPGPHSAVQNHLDIRRPNAFANEKVLYKEIEFCRIFHETAVTRSLDDPVLDPRNELRCLGPTRKSSVKFPVYDQRRQSEVSKVGSHGQFGEYFEYSDDCFCIDVSPLHDPCQQVAADLESAHFCVTPYLRCDK